jgi:nicotinamidase-related amidase
LILIDVQNTFCIPDYGLFVAGRSGMGAVEDNRRLCEFIYRNAGSITEIAPTMDTHTPLQIFHALFLVDQQGNHPGPNTMITHEEIRKGIWKFNPAVAGSIGIDPAYGQEYLLHYTSQLTEKEKYDLTIWPYHSMLGGIGHALVSAVEEAIFFHSVARYARADFLIKGDNPLTEHYSAVGPEILVDHEGKQIAQKSSKFIQKLRNFDIVVIAGQAKSHCVAWTINDLLEDVRQNEESLVEKVYLLEDCTSPVVIPDVVDFTEQADAAFERFAEAGMHIVRSDQPIASWPGVKR